MDAGQAIDKAKSSRRADWAGDLWGGLAAMLVALPSAIAFGVAIFAPLSGSAAAAGALAGILGATALGLMASAFGGRSRLITAPCAPAAAVLAALATSLTAQGMEAHLVLIQLGAIALLAGAVQIGLGVAGVGKLIKFIPYPVVSGYLSGVGLIIIGGQIPKFVGAPAGAGFLDALRAPSAWTWQSIVIGTVVIVAMLLIPRLIRVVPAVILALAAGMATYGLLGLFDPALRVTADNPLLVGALGQGDASLMQAVREHWQSFGGLDPGEIARLVLPALTLAALLSIDTLKTCLVMDAMTSSHHDPNRELVGQGLGNIASALIGGIPGSGTMGATLVNLSSGGRTWRSGVTAGGLSLLAFLLLAPLIAWVPIAALAGILMVIGARMIDRRSLAFFFTPATRLDFAVILSVILVAIFGNLIAASGVGVALAILLFIREQTRSSIIRSRIEGHEIFSKRARTDTGVERDEPRGSNVVIFELQGSLFFGTASQLLAALEPETDKRKYVLLSMRRVQSLDVTATHVLEQIKDRLEENGAYLVFCDIPKDLPSGLKMKHFLKATGVVRPSNKAFAFRQLDEALEWVEAQETMDGPGQPSDAIPVDLRAMPLLAGCSDEAVAALAAAAELRTVKAGKRVFKAGADGDALFFIRRGTVKLTVPIHKKESYHLATCGPGEVVGDMGFIEVGRQAMDALAVIDTEVYALTRERFEVLAMEHGDLMLAVIGDLAHNLATRLHAVITEVQALRG
jgi:SulP family sulfate permease